MGEAPPQLHAEHVLTYETLAAIGLVAAQWSFLERTMRSEVAKMLRLKWITLVLAITKSAGARDLVQMISNLLDHGYMREADVVPIRACLKRG